MLADANASPEHGAGSSIACKPDVVHLLLEAAREANADLARDAETDANMLEVQCLLFSQHCIQEPYLVQEQLLIFQ